MSSNKIETDENLKKLQTILEEALLLVKHLSNDDAASLRPETKKEGSPKEDGIVTGTLKFTKLIKTTGLQKEQLGLIYDFEAEPFSLNPGKVRGKIPEQQVIAAKLLLLGHGCLFDKKNIQAVVLRQQIDDAGININNLAKNLKKQNIKLVAGSSAAKSCYRLLGPGKIEAIAILKRLCV